MTFQERIDVAQQYRVLAWGKRLNVEGKIRPAVKCSEERFTMQ